MFSHRVGYTSNCNTNEISHTLKVLYNDLVVYFYVCNKVIFMIIYIDFNVYNYAYVCILSIYWIWKLIF
jgi:hypothetical protein